MKIRLLTSWLWQNWDINNSILVHYQHIDKFVIIIFKITWDVFNKFFYDRLKYVCKEIIYIFLKYIRFWLGKLADGQFIFSSFFFFLPKTGFDFSFRSCPLNGVVGWGKSFVFITSPGCPIDIGLSWARPANLAASKGRGEIFLFLQFLNTFIFLFHPCPCLSPLLLSLLSLFSLSLGNDTKWPTRVDFSLNPKTISRVLWR